MPDLDITSAALRTGLALVGRRPTTLWVEYVSLGGTLDQSDFIALLDDGGLFPSEQFDRAAHALNELAGEAGLGHPVQYWNEL